MNRRSAVFIHVDATCMSMSMLSLSYDQNAFKMQRLSVCASGNLLHQVTSADLLTSVHFATNDDSCINWYCQM